MRTVPMVILLSCVLLGVAAGEDAPRLAPRQAAQAARTAQEHVRAQRRWAHPYVWAAWVLWGLPE